MQAHASIRDVADRLSRLDAQVVAGKIEACDAIEKYAFLAKEGTLGLSRLASAVPTEANDKDLSIPFIVTTLRVDRDGDVVIPMGIRTDNYKLNPVWFFGHQQHPIPIGKGTDDSGNLDFTAREQDARSVCHFDKADPDSVFIYGKVKRGFLNTTSIAFVPINARRRDPEEEKGLLERAHPHTSPMQPPGWLFEEVDLTEISIVGVPSNAGAEAIRHSLDHEKSFITPRLQKALLPYAAKSLGKSFSGWCPVGTKQVGCSCVPVEKSAGGSVNPDARNDVEPPADPYWDVIIDNKAWGKVTAPDEKWALEDAKWRIDTVRRAQMPKDYTEEEFRAKFPKPKIEVRGPYDKAGKKPEPAQTTKESQEDQEMPDESPPQERWNKSLSSAFDQMPELQMSKPGEVDASTTHRVASKYLSCAIKDLHQSSTMVPSPRMGSFLTGLQLAIKEYRIAEVRNLSDRSESPPVYETIQLKSDTRGTFLVQGTMFLEAVAPRGKRPGPLMIGKAVTSDQVKGAGPHNNYGRGIGEAKLVVKLRPEWGGLNVTVLTKRSEAQINQKIIDSAWQWAKEHNFLKGEAFALSGEFLERTSEGWNDVFLEDENRKAIQRTLDLFNKKGLGFANRGVILTGPPGTGKTLSGRIIRNQAKGTFIWVSSRDFFSSGSAGGLSMAFEMAKELAPAVLFMEDVDNWLSDRSIDLLKTEMDGIARSKGVLTILTTNFPEQLPDALIDRPGRFHDVLNFDLPDDAARKAMLRKWLPQTSLENIQEAVDKSQGFSGAHVYELAHFAKSLQEYDDFPPTKALSEALRKVEEQRAKIQKLQNAGAGYDTNRRKRGDPLPRYKSDAPVIKKSFPAGEWPEVEMGQVQKATCSCGKSQCTCKKKAVQKGSFTIGERVYIWSGEYKGQLGTIVGSEKTETPPYVEFPKIKLDSGKTIIEQFSRTMPVSMARLMGKIKAVQKVEPILPSRSAGGQHQLPVRNIERIRQHLISDVFRGDKTVESLPEFSTWLDSARHHYMELRDVESRMKHRGIFENALRGLIRAYERATGKKAKPLSEALNDLPSDGTKSVRRIVSKYITHSGSKWIVHAESGKVLGTHDTKESAERQLAAVEANKHKALGRIGKSSEPLPPPVHHLDTQQEANRIAQEQAPWWPAFKPVIGQDADGWYVKWTTKALRKGDGFKVGDKVSLDGYDNWTVLAVNSDGTCKVSGGELGIKVVAEERLRPKKPLRTKGSTIHAEDAQAGQEVIIGQGDSKVREIASVEDVGGKVKFTFADGTSAVRNSDYPIKVKALSESSGSAGGYTVAVSENTDSTQTSGAILCVECGGSGECPGCDGSGSVDSSNCAKCGGSGECPRCAGAGEIGKSVIQRKPKSLPQKSIQDLMRA